MNVELSVGTQMTQIGQMLAKKVSANQHNQRYLCAIQKGTQMTQNTQDEIDNLLPLVLHPLNHNDINKNEHGIEIGRTVNILNTLKTELNV